MVQRLVRLLMAALFVLCCIATAAQTVNDYLDTYMVQVKPDKRADFDAIVKKMAAANRNGGDQWLMLDTMYGDGDVVTFISTRSSYGDVEKGMNAFMGSINKAYGEDGAKKLFADFGSCVSWSHAEIRQRRWDLSSNAPKDRDAYFKLLGQSRYLRTTIVTVKPGRVAEFEAMVKEVKSAREKGAPDQVQLVSQAVAGAEGTVFYITMLKPSLEAFDSVPPMQQLLGDDGYQKWLKTNADVVQNTRSVILRFAPELSNPQPEVAAVSPDFWNPKPVVAAKKPAKKGQSEAGR